MMLHGKYPWAIVLTCASTPLHIMENECEYSPLIPIVNEWILHILTCMDTPMVQMIDNIDRAIP